TVTWSALFPSDRLDFAILQHAPTAALAADAAFFEAAEGRMQQADRPVDIDRAGADALGDLEPLRNVGRINGAAESVKRVVGDADGLLGVAERQHGQH